MHIYIIYVNMKEECCLLKNVQIKECSNLNVYIYIHIGLCIHIYIYIYILQFENAKLSLSNFTVSSPFNREINYTCFDWHSSLE